MENDEYRSLGNSYKLILELYSSDGQLQGGQLRRAIKNYDTAKRVARELQSIGLIDVEINGRPTAHWYKLTEKGTKVAELLAEAEKIILNE